MISAYAGMQSDINELFTRALLQGKISLIERPDKELINLPNPYDYTVREDIRYIWDVALYILEYYHFCYYHYHIKYLLENICH